MLVLFLCKTSIYLRIFFSEPQNREILGGINVKISIIEKSQKPLRSFSL